MAELDVAAAEKQQMLAELYAKNPYYAAAAAAAAANYNFPKTVATTGGGVPRRVHWRSATPLDRDLLRPATRPLALRNVYARAHAPGDLRLASHTSSGHSAGIGYPSPYITMLRSMRNGGGGGNHPNLAVHIGAEQRKHQQQQQCRCDCGQCHHIQLQQQQQQSKSSCVAEINGKQTKKVFFGSNKN